MLTYEFETIEDEHNGIMTLIIDGEKKRWSEDERQEVPNVLM